MGMGAECCIQFQEASDILTTCDPHWILDSEKKKEEVGRRGKGEKG